jgi:Tfp pilus assembly protein PilO
MIKNTIIVILLLLLIITFYAYICLSSNMLDYEKERMQNILNKEVMLKQKEKELVNLKECNDTMNKYKNIINKLSIDLTKSMSNFSEIVNYVNETNNNSKLNNEISLPSIISPLTTTPATTTPALTIPVSTKLEVNTELNNKPEPFTIEINENFENLDELDKPINDEE